MSETCGQYEPLYSPRNVFFSCVIAQYFISFLFEHTVYAIDNIRWKVSQHKIKVSDKLVGAEKQFNHIQNLVLGLARLTVFTFSVFDL